MAKSSECPACYFDAVAHALGTKRCDESIRKLLRTTVLLDELQRRELDKKRKSPARKK